jgi:hypothetical protein
MNPEQIEQVIDRATTELYRVESLLTALSSICPQSSSDNDEAVANLGPSLRAVASLIGQISGDLAVLL